LYLLYIDESGNENGDDRFFVLAGVALFERQTWHLANALEGLQRDVFPDEHLAFHVEHIRSGKKQWRKIGNREARAAIVDRLCDAVMDSPHRGRKFFAVVVEKTAEMRGEAAVARATEELSRRFDLFLARQPREERGLMIFSEGRFDARARILISGFRTEGTQWGTLRRLADVPYFAPMKETRLLQVADLIAHAVWIQYERGDSTLLRRMASGFDQRRGVLDGLVHYRPGLSPQHCDCPACSSRTSRGQNWGPWLVPSSSVMGVDEAAADDGDAAATELS
jgi:hypothetical protein